MSAVAARLAILVAAAALFASPGLAQAPPDRPRVNLAGPPVLAQAREARVLRHEQLLAYAQSFAPDAETAAAGYRDLHRLATALGFAVLRDNGQPLTIHVYCDAIEPLAAGDKIWEGLPRRVDSTQHLIDLAIARCRATGKPLARLIILGHSGVGGTGAFGSTPDDCVFRGRLADHQRQQLARLRPYLAEDAVIELRQCSAGQGHEGTRLLEQVHAATGAAAESYFGDFYFGKTDREPRKRVDAEGVRVIRPR